MVSAVVAMQSRMPRRYRSGVRDAQARRTRQRVLDAATAVFLDRGYGGATIRAIADGAKVSVPPVEALFGPKAPLLKPAIHLPLPTHAQPLASHHPRPPPRPPH